MAAKLDGGIAPKRVGTALLLKVMPGDRFDISVNAYYDGGTVPEDHAGAADMVASLSSALLGGQNYDGIPLDELPDNVKTIQGIFDKPELVTALDNLYKDDDLSRPRAHLNWLFFNDKMEITGMSGSTQVPLAATGWFTIDPGMATGGLGTPSNQVIATLPGYVIVYIDNQTIGKEVWFDNLMVGHYTSTVVEENHYYPFGLTLQTDANLNVTGNPYKYNGKELEKSFGLESYDYGARVQDPQLGVWHAPDQMAEKFAYESPYCYAGNNPVRNIDVGGLYKTDEQTAKDYPIIKIMADRYLPGLKYNAEIKQAFLENIKGMTEQQFNEMVGQNSGLTIVAAEEGGTSEWDPRYPDKIFISKDLLEETQRAFDKAKNTRDGNDLMVKMFETSLGVLHESSHQKADQLGVKDQESSNSMIEYERGFSFEDKAFGKNATTNTSRTTGIKIRDYDKVKNLALKTYGTTKGFGMTISGYNNLYWDRKKLGIKAKDNEQQ